MCEQNGESVDSRIPLTEFALSRIDPLGVSVSLDPLPALNTISFRVTSCILPLDEMDMGPCNTEIDHPDTLHSLNNLGGLLYKQAKLGEAEVQFRRALEERESMLGVDDLDTLTSMYNLAAP